MTDYHNVPVGSLVRINTAGRGSDRYHGDVGIVICFKHFDSRRDSTGFKGDPVVLWSRRGKQRMARSRLVVLSRPKVKE
jgi:hypothetical protein